MTLLPFPEGVTVSGDVCITLQRARNDRERLRGKERNSRSYYRSKNVTSFKKSFTKLAERTTDRSLNAALDPLWPPPLHSILQHMVFFLYLSHVVKCKNITEEDWSSLLTRQFWRSILKRIVPLLLININDDLGHEWQCIIIISSSITWLVAKATAAVAQMIHNFISSFEDPNCYHSVSQMCYWRDLKWAKKRKNKSV